MELKKKTQVLDQLNQKLQVSGLASVYIFLKASQGILTHSQVREQLNLENILSLAEPKQHF